MFHVYEARDVDLSKCAPLLAGGTAADDQCFETFNSKGSINGHCGSSGSGTFVKCSPENVKCGTLHCQKGKRKPVLGSGTDQLPFSRTFVTIQGTEYECK